MRPLGAGQAVEQPIGAIGLKVAPDLIELLSAIADHPARLDDVAEMLPSSNRLSLRRATFLSMVMSISVRDLEVVRNTILTSPEGGMATPLAVAQTLDGPRPERVALLSGDYCLRTAGRLTGSANTGVLLRYQRPCETTASPIPEIPDYQCRTSSVRR